MTAGFVIGGALYHRKWRVLELTILFVTVRSKYGCIRSSVSKNTIPQGGVTARVIGQFRDSEIQNVRAISNRRGVSDSKITPSSMPDVVRQ